MHVDGIIEQHSRIVNQFKRDQLAFVKAEMRKNFLILATFATHSLLRHKTEGQYNSCEKKLKLLKQSKSLVQFTQKRCQNAFRKTQEIKCAGTHHEDRKRVPEKSEMKHNRELILVELSFQMVS